MKGLTYKGGVQHTYRVKAKNIKGGKEMKNVKKLFALFFVLGLLFIFTACGGGDETTDSEASDSGDDANDTEEVVEGGELNIAINAQPPSLDPQTTTATAARDTARMMFESLVVLNADHEPVPFLAEEIDNEDNQHFTFHLREGVMFHNGEEMKADDVVASMNRWKENENKAKKIIGDAEFKEEDEYTVTLELEEPSSLIMGLLATPGQFGAIMPKEVNEEAGPDGVTEYIGTGPYEFEEWQQDNYIHFTKFEDYQPVEEESDGLSGKKEAFLDDIYFYISEDASTRQAGLQSGEYDLAYQLPFDSYQQLMETDDLKVEPSLAGDMILQYNSREGLMSDPKMRQAINAALDIDEILAASLVEPEIYESEATLMESENVQWATNAGEEAYNQNDQEKAKELLEEAGYDGETVKIVSTRDYQHYYDSSVVIKEQLENIGMEVDLEVYDWPTLTELVEEDDKWHMRVNGFTFKPDPTQILYLDSDYAGVAEDDKLDSFVDAIEAAETEEEAQAEWEDLQTHIWTEFLPATKLGTYSHLYVMSEDVDGFVYSNGGIFWNISVNK